MQARKKTDFGRDKWYRDSQLMVRSSHSCLLVFRFWAVVWPPSCGPSPAADGLGTAIRLAWTPLSRCMLAMLRPSSSVMVVSAMLGGLAESPLSLLTEFSPPAFMCWSSYVIFSVSMASSILEVTVGRRARTVKLQSSWFCSKRRRRLFCHPIYPVRMYLQLYQTKLACERPSI